MKNLNPSFGLLAVFALASSAGFAQSVPEKAAATGNDVKRSVKKSANRVQEALCTGTKAECAAKKLKHRATETKDAVVDEAKEVKDKVD